MMSKKRKRTISLSLNFDDKYEYRFTVDIDRRKFTWQQAQELFGKNRFEEKFELRDLGPALMDLLVVLGHATASTDYWGEADPWNVLAERRSDAPVAAWFTDVLQYKDPQDDRSAENLGPAAGEPASDGQVIQVELSPKAK
jgi:hypothetical protein